LKEIEVTTEAKPQIAQEVQGPSKYLCPFTFANGAPGYSLYSESGVRVFKDPLKPGETAEQKAKELGLEFSKFPPNTNRPKVKSRAPSKR